MISVPVFAQQQKTWQWLNHIGGKGWDMTNGIAIDSKDNIYIAGTYTSDLTFQGQDIKSKGNHDIYIARFNNDGKLIWLWGNGSRKSDNINDITTDLNDNIIIGGMISDSIKFDKISACGKDKMMFTAMLDSRGKFSWVKTISFTGNASLHLLENSINGSIYAAGVFSDKLTIDDMEINTNGRNDVFIVKFDPGGKFEDIFSFGGEGHENIYALRTDNDGNLICSGNFISDFSIDSMNIKYSGNYKNPDTYIIKFTNMGKAVWAKTITGSEYISIGALETDNQNNVLAAGNFSLNIEVNDKLFRSNGRTDIFIIKYSPEGNMSWIRQFGSKYYDYVYNLNIDKLNGAYITGSFGDSIQFDTISIYPLAQSTDAFIAQISSKGNVMWAEKINGTGKDFCKGATLDKEGNLYITGSFRKTLTQSGKEFKSLGGEDIFVAKYYNCPESQNEIENAGPLCPGEERELYVKSGYRDIIWNDNVADQNRFTINQPGRYWVKMRDKRGCLITDTVEIQSVIHKQFSLGNDTVMLASDSIFIEAPENFAEYRWQDYSGERNYLVKAPDQEPGVYDFWVCATDSFGCTASDTISVKFIEDFNWIVLTDETSIVTYPNPVDKWLNWYIKTDEYSKLFLELANENGSVVYNEKVARYFPYEIKHISMEGYPYGAYYLSISNNKNKKTIKIIHDQ